MVADQQQRTWSGRHEYHAVWTGALATEKKGWTALGVRPLEACGCLVDDYAGGQIWEPCVAHEADGHVCVLSEQDGMYVARCLVLSCAWVESRMSEADTIGAAQGHWRDTAGKAAENAAGS